MIYVNALLWFHLNNYYSLAQHSYVNGAIPGSINIPLSGVDLEADNTIGTAIPECPELSILCSNKGKIIVVGGDDKVDSAKVNYSVVYVVILLKYYTTVVALLQKHLHSHHETSIQNHMPPQIKAVSCNQIILFNILAWYCRWIFDRVLKVSKSGRREVDWRCSQCLMYVWNKSGLQGLQSPEFFIILSQR